MRVELRGSAWPGRPAPSPRTNSVDLYFERHAGPGAIDRHGTAQSMSDVAREISWGKVARLAEPGFLLNRAPARVQRLEQNHVARLDRQCRCQLTGKISVQRCWRRVQPMFCHLCKPFSSPRCDEFHSVKAAAGAVSIAAGALSTEQRSVIACASRRPSNQHACRSSTDREARGSTAWSSITGGPACAGHDGRVLVPGMLDRCA